jgi:pyruvate formate lyase activating enzyme
MTVQDVVDEVMRDEDFYRNSSGGVTASGGEALWQSEFVAKLFKICKMKGLHTALNTTGFAAWGQFSKVLNFTDLVLFDIKHLDPGKHKSLTGVDNGRILKNLEKIVSSKKIWLRMPVLSGVNDSDGYIREIVALSKRVKAEKVSLLPYHEGGKSKCVQLGKVYLCSQEMVPSDERMQRLKDLISAEGINVSIGS